jgi:hypothetical protein
VRGLEMSRETSRYATGSADTQNDESSAILQDGVDNTTELLHLRNCALRVSLVSHLISQLDILLFAEIAAVYYQEYDV